MNENSKINRPWYREPWPWVAIAIPGSAVIMGFITLYLAITNPDPVIIDEQRYEEISSGLKAQPTPAPGQTGQGDAGESSDGEH